MILRFLKTLSISFMAVTLAAAAATASDEKADPGLSSNATENASNPCSAQSDIDRGWDYQRQLIEERLTARMLDPTGLPGAIISPPFASPSAYSVDPSSVKAARSSDPRLRLR